MGGIKWSELGWLVVTLAMLVLILSLWAISDAWGDQTEAIKECLKVESSEAALRCVSSEV